MMNLMGMKKILVYLFAWLNLAFIFYFWSQSSGYLLTGGVYEITMGLGRLFGLLAVFFILSQLILIGRVAWVEKIFGLDKLSRVHHYNGFLVLSFLLLHPIFLGIGYSGLNETNFFSQIWTFLTEWEDVLGAAIALLLFSGVVILSVSLIKKHLKYEFWFLTHLFTYVAILSAIGHQFEVGTDLQSGLTNGYWVGLYAFAFVNFIIFRSGRPIYNFLRHGFYIDRVIKETDDSVSVYIKGKEMGKFKIQAGQFMIFRFLDRKYFYEAHPFSLSKMYDGKEIRITIKNEGDFTAKAKDFRPGTKVLIDGPNGIFTEKVCANKKVLFIAGGVGITPIRSLIEAMVKKEKDISLVYGNRAKKDIIFLDELEKLCEVKHFPIFHVLSGQESWTGMKGRIDIEKVRVLAPDFMERDIFLCGPPPMMNSLKSQLKTAGYDLSKLHYEKFSL